MSSNWALLLAVRVLLFSALGQSVFLQKLATSNISANGSHAGSASSRDSAANSTLRSKCSFVGPAWDPLHDCFPAFGSFEATDAVRQDILCKLKARLGAQAAAAFPPVATGQTVQASQWIAMGPGCCRGDRLSSQRLFAGNVADLAACKRKCVESSYCGAVDYFPGGWCFVWSRANPCSSLDSSPTGCGAAGGNSGVHAYRYQADLALEQVGNGSRVLHSLAHVRAEHNDTAVDQDILSFPSFRTCAVVSNSGVMKRHQHGSAIDLSEVVLRFNDAPVSYYAQAVGHKDTARITNQKFPARVLARSIYEYSYQPSTSLGIIPFMNPPRLQEFRSKYPTAKVKLINMALLKSIELGLRDIYHAGWFNRNGVSFEPTSGAVGMFAAMAVCDEVKAYGMAATPAAHHAPYHYYGAGGSATMNYWHKTFSAEKDLWRRIARNPSTDIDNTDVATIPGFSTVQCR